MKTGRTKPKKMKLFILLMLVTLFTGCGGGGGSTGSSYAGSADTSTSTAVTKTIQEGQVKDSLTGNGLADVKVSIGNSTTITDANGFYTLSNLTASEEAVVNFEKEGNLIVMIGK